MLCYLIWIIESVYVVMNGTSAVNCFKTVNELKNNPLTSGLSDFYNNLAISYIINIAISLIFCYVITIAYKTSKENKEKLKFASKNINNINNYLGKLSNAIQCAKAKTKTQAINTTNEIKSNPKPTMKIKNK